MPRTDDLAAWRSFVVFARSGTLTAAAAVLDVEPSSLSRAITALEKSLGCELIRHNSRPLALTDAGKTALKRIEPILRAHGSLMDALREENRTLDGRIRLSAAAGFATRQLMPHLKAFGDAYPGISIDIMTGIREADVAKGLCDVATLTGEPTLPGLVYMSRGRNLYLPVASPDYIRRNGMPVVPENLKTHTGFIYSGPVREETRLLYRGSRSEPVQFGSAVRSTDVLAVRSAVLDGMGIAVDMPLVQIYEDLLEGRLVPVLPGWSRPPIECYIVTNRDAWHMKRVRVFLEWYAKAMQTAFAGYEEAVSAIVGLPPDRPGFDRSEVFMTGTGRKS